MNVIEMEITGHHLERLKDRALAELGLESDEEQPTKTSSMIDETLLEVKEILKPRGLYRTLPVLGIDKQGINTETGTIRSAMMARLVDMCRGDLFIVFMIATLGDEFQRIERSKKAISDQWILDKVGSELIEMVADLVEEKGRALTKDSGLHSSMRFSPGYCDWELNGQTVIFSALDARQIGVRLTPHFVMIPSKTISAIALLAREVPAPSSCVFCDKGDCQWRRLAHVHP
jgi:hypothetical protein